MIKIGHRGACGYKPENTLSSFVKAIALGVDMIELDVHVTRDGYLVVRHDEEILVGNKKEKISTKILRELQIYDAGQGEHIPTLFVVLLYE